MKNLLTIALFSTLTMIGCTSYANNHQTTFEKVKSKFLTDQIAKSEFRYLGKLHCIGNHFYQKNNANKEEIFQIAYADTFNQMNGLTRLFDEQKIKETFDKFEERNLKKQTIDAVAFCHSLYENNGDNLYQEFISNKNNYLVTHIKKDDNNHEPIWLDMQDYLKYGRLDASRYIDGCQTYDCK